MYSVGCVIYKKKCNFLHYAIVIACDSRHECKEKHPKCMSQDEFSFLQGNVHDGRLRSEKWRTPADPQYNPPPIEHNWAESKAGSMAEREHYKQCHKWIAKMWYPGFPYRCTCRFKQCYLKSMAWPFHCPFVFFFFGFMITYTLAALVLIIHDLVIWKCITDRSFPWNFGQMFDKSILDSLIFGQASYFTQHHLCMCLWVTAPNQHQPI